VEKVCHDITPSSRLLSREYRDDSLGATPFVRFPVKGLEFLGGGEGFIDPSGELF